MLTIETIKKRVSCRTYESDPMKEGDQQKLTDFLLTNVRGPFGNRVRFELVDLAAKERDEIKTLGTYGFIKGASMFIVGAVANGARSKSHDLGLARYLKCRVPPKLLLKYLP